MRGRARRLARQRARRWRDARARPCRAAGVAPAAAGTARRSSRRPVRRSLRWRGRRCRSAPLHTSDTCVASPAVTWPLVERPLERPPGQAENGVSSTGRSNHRFTVTMGERASPTRAAIVAQRPRAPASLAQSWSSACHGTAEIDAPRGDVLVADAARRRPGRRRTRRAPAAPAMHCAAAALEKRHGRLDERVRQRLRRQHQRRVVGARAEHPADHLHERAGRWRGRWAD